MSSPPEDQTIQIVSADDESGAGRQTYYFVNDDRSLRAFIFETTTTNDKLHEVEVLNNLFEWIAHGKCPPKLKVAK